MAGLLAQTTPAPQQPGLLSSYVPLNPSGAPMLPTVPINFAAPAKAPTPVPAPVKPGAGLLAQSQPSFLQPTNIGTPLGQSTPQQPVPGAVDPLGLAWQYVAQPTIREAASAGQTVLSALGAPRQVPGTGPDAAGLSRFLYGNEPVKTYQARVADDTAANLAAANKLPSYPGLTVTGKATKENQQGLALPQAVGGVFMGATSLIPGAGAEEGAVKALVAVKDIAEASRIARSIGIAEDLVPQFAERAVTASTPEEVKSLVDSFANLQNTTKVSTAAKTTQEVLPPTAPLQTEGKGLLASSLDKTLPEIPLSHPPEAGAPQAPAPSLPEVSSLPHPISTASKESIPFNPQEYIAAQTAAADAARNAGATTVFGGAKNFLNDLKAKLVDFSAPIEDVLNAAVKKNNISLKPTEDIHNQIDRVLRAPTIAGQFAKDNGLVQAIRDTPNVNALDQYLIAKHAVDLDTRGIATGRDLAKDQALVQALAPQYEAQAQIVNAYAQKLLDYSVQSGLVSKKLATTLKERYPNYVPFNRVFSEEEKAASNFGTKAIASLGKQTAVQAIKGSEREIESPIHSLLAKTHDVITQGEKNLAAKMLAGYEKLPGNPFQLKEIGAAEDVANGRRISLPGDKSQHTISFFDNGEKRVFATTKEIADAAKALNVQQINILGKILAFPVRVARLGITGVNLPFVGANIAKDQVSAFINSSHALRGSIANPVNFSKALFNAVGHGDLYQEMVRAGGAGTSFDIARNQVESTVKSIRAGRNPITKVAYTVTHPSELLRAVENIVGRSEEFTRLQQYAGTKSGLLAKGMSQEDAIAGGARAARDNTVNFARRGQWGTVLNSAWLYLNANIQGTRTLLRNLKDKPIQTGIKIAVSAMFPMAAATAWNLSDDKRRAAYNDIPDYEKQNNIIIIPPNPTQDAQGKWNVIKIPLSQEINNLVNIPRKAVEQAYGVNPLKFGDFAQALLGTVSPINPTSGNALSTITPQAFKPTLEGAFNKNLFTGIPQVPDSMKNLSPENQVKPWTSGTARVVSKPFGVSPIKTEEFVKGTFGGVGSQLLNASDHALASAGVIPKDQIGGQELLPAITARFNKAAGGASNQQAVTDLQGRITSQADTAAQTKTAAQSKLDEVLASSDKKAAFNQVIKDNPSLAKEIVTLYKAQQKNLSYDEKLVNQLQVANGARAQYIFEQINKLSDPAAKKAYYQSMIDKGIVSKTVNAQVLKLLNKK